MGRRSERITGEVKPMSTTQEQFADIAQRGQEALIKTATGWVDGLREYIATATSTITGAQADLPDGRDLVNSAVDGAFDVAEQLLRSQRELAATLLGAGAEVADATRKAAAQLL